MTTLYKVQISIQGNTDKEGNYVKQLLFYNINDSYDALRLAVKICNYEAQKISIINMKLFKNNKPIFSWNLKDQKALEVFQEAYKRNEV